jgi:hypothetical protein
MLHCWYEEYAVSLSADVVAAKILNYSRLAMASLRTTSYLDSVEARLA